MIINSIGYHHPHGESFSVDRPWGTGGFLLILIKTPAVFRQNGKDIITKRNSFILYREGIAQHYRAYGEEYIDDWIHFMHEDSEEYHFPEKLRIPLGEVVCLEDISELSWLIRTMTCEYYSKGNFNEKISSLYIWILIYKLADKIRLIEHCGKADKIKLLRADIYNSPQKNRTVDEMAKELSMSRSGFQHTYKKLFGVGVTHDINESRLERAKMLLSSTNLTVREIAEQSGFGSDTYFMRRFREKLNMTPTDYRRNR